MGEEPIEEAGPCWVAMKTLRFQVRRGLETNQCKVVVIQQVPVDYNTF